MIYSSNRLSKLNPYSNLQINEKKPDPISMVLENGAYDDKIFNLMLKHDVLEITALAESNTVPDAVLRKQEELDVLIEGAFKNKINNARMNVTATFDGLRKKLFGYQKNMKKWMKYKKVFLDKDLYDMKCPTNVTSESFAHAVAPCKEIALFVRETVDDATASLSGARGAAPKDMTAKLYGRLMGKNTGTEKDFERMYHKSIYPRETDYPFQDNPKLQREIVEHLSFVGKGSFDWMSLLDTIEKNIVQSLEVLESRLTVDGYKEYSGAIDGVIMVIIPICNMVKREAENILKEYYRIYRMGLKYDPTKATTEEAELVLAVGDEAIFEFESYMESTIDYVVEEKEFDVDAYFRDHAYSFLD